VKRYLTYAAVVILTLPVLAQKKDPVQWSLAAEPEKVPPGSQVVFRLTAKVDPGWHVYAPTTPPGGPIITSIKLADSPALAEAKLYEPKPERKLDKNFNLDVEVYDGAVDFLFVSEVKRDAPRGPVEVTAQVRYQACTDVECLNPVRKTATTKFWNEPSVAQPAAFSVPSGYIEVTAAKRAAAPSQAAPAAPAAQESYGWFLLAAFGFGVAAIFTPCVFPMIPITMSFFLNRPQATRSGAVAQAAVFSLGIVVLFTGIGLATTAILGPFGIVQIGSNPWVNSFIAIVFIAFGLSLLGAFEITLPSGLLTKMDSASRRGGFAGTLLMGLTFALTSFACVGPFMGSLLAASVQGDRLLPVLGMTTFATGLASPFFLLALFPGYLARMPKSGGWLATVKVVLGFVLLAIALKYLSSVDQVFQTNILTRERFLAAWVVLFALPGLYLLGFLRLPGIKPDETLNLKRLLAGAAFLSFSISLMPGMFGAKLGELDAYVPSPTGSGFAAASGEKLDWMKNQYREALARGRQEGKLIFVSFTGYACTNCHWMKANMFTRPEVASLLRSFVLVELYTDGTDPESELHQKLQESKFQSVSIPFYAILDADERVIASSAGATRDTSKFVAFLKSGQPAATATTALLQ
jgi:thiol:disulfide interchange protein